MASDFSQPADLTNSQELAKECKELAGGMRQQATASQAGTALSGHPYPAYFYGRVAAALEASAVKLEEMPLPAADPTPPKPTEEPKSDKPSGKKTT